MAGSSAPGADALVAEFVADPSILEVVRAEGVDLAQGYLTGARQGAHAIARRVALTST